MSEQKTLPTAVAVQTYLDAIEDEKRREDCLSLVALMQRVSGQEAVMWGPSIVGFGQYHYTYASGHSGTACRIGFSCRKSDLTLYLASGYEGHEALLEQLGKYKMGKSCLYVKRLTDVKADVLEALVRGGWEEMGRRYP